MTRGGRLFVIMALLLSIGGGHPVPLHAATPVKPAFEIAALCTNVVGTGIISGRVTNAATGDPIMGVRVTARTVEENFVPGASDFTDADGEYVIDELQTGEYLVLTEYENEEGGERLISQVYDGQPWTNTFTPVAVTNGNVTAKIDFALPSGATISGRVTDSTTDQPADGAVVLFRVVKGAFTTQQVATSFVNGDGDYVFDAGVPPGAYKLGYTPGQLSGDYVGEFFEDKATLGEADIITISQAISYTYDFEVEPADNGGLETGEVRGTITDAATDAELESIRIFAKNVETGDLTSGMQTDDSGEYSIKLPVGNYKIGANPERPFLGATDSRDYRGRYYGGDGTLEGAEVISVTNTLIQGIDIGLSKGGRIAGRVTGDPGGVGIAGASIRAYMTSDAFDDQDGVQFVSTFADATGVYTLPALANGVYTVSVSIGSECFYLSSLPDRRVTVNSTGIIPNIDFVAGQAGAVSGRITDPDTGAGISQLVEIEDAAGNRIIGVFSAQSGYFFIRGLAPGQYYLNVEFEDGVVYYGQVGSRAEADPITVQANQIAEDIDVEAATPDGVDAALFLPRSDK